MRGIYKSLAIAVASLSLLGGPADAALTGDQAAALQTAISNGNAGDVQAIINAAGNDAVALAAIANMLTTAPAGGTVNTSLLVTIATANGGNTGLVGALGLAMATNLTPAVVQTVLTQVVLSNPTAANALGPVIAANGSLNMVQAVSNSGASIGSGSGGTQGGNNQGGNNQGGNNQGQNNNNQGSEKSGQVNGSQ
jgi:hypothetical protein